VDPEFLGMPVFFFVPDRPDKTTESCFPFAPADHVDVFIPVDLLGVKGIMVFSEDGDELQSRLFQQPVKSLEIELLEGLSALSDDPGLEIPNFFQGLLGSGRVQYKEIALIAFLPGDRRKDLGPQPLGLKVVEDDE